MLGCFGMGTILRRKMTVKTDLAPQIRHIPPTPPYTPDPPYSPYGHGRSNGWSFLTSTNLKPWTAPRNYLISECLCDFRPKNANLTPPAHFWGCTNSRTQKSDKHSYLMHFSDTVQGLGLVLVRNDQPFDLPCLYVE